MKYQVISFNLIIFFLELFLGAMASAAPSVITLHYKTVQDSTPYEVRVDVESNDGQAPRIYVYARTESAMEIWKGIADIGLERFHAQDVTLLVTLLVPLPSQDGTDPAIPLRKLGIKFDYTSFNRVLEQSGVFLVRGTFSKRNDSPEASPMVYLLNIPARYANIPGDSALLFIDEMPRSAEVIERHYFVQRPGSVMDLKSDFGIGHGTGGLIFSVVDVMKNGTFLGSGTGLVVSRRYHHFTNSVDWIANPNTRWQLKAGETHPGDPGHSC